MVLDRTLLTSVLRDCGWEIIPQDKIAALAAKVQLDDVDDLVRVVENLDLTALEHDAGDIGDEYWRVSSSVARVLVTLGPMVMPRLGKHRNSHHTYVNMLVEMVDAALKDPAYFG
jgi:hypothetical protein